MAVFSAQSVSPGALAPAAVVGVIGAGAMGAGIAQVAAAAGHPVLLYDLNEAACDKALAGIRAQFARLAEKGRLDPAQAQAAANRVSAVRALADFAPAALVVEAAAERLDVKREIFATLERHVDDACLLATNTSSISITAIAAGLRAPQRVAGLHFFNPAPLMALVEVVSGLATAPEVAQALYDTAAAWGKRPVLAKSTPGFIVNRVARPYYAEALRVLNEQGGAPASIDAVMREAGGFRMGPFELMDLIGHDVNFAVTESVFRAYFNDPRFTPSLIQQELVNAGFLGRKSGRGFYSYADGAAPPAPDVEPPCDAPAAVTLFAQDGPADALRARIAERAAGARHAHAHSDDLLATAGRASIALTDGRTATERAAQTGVADLVLVDLARDYAQAGLVALTRALQCSDAAYADAVGLFQQAGFRVVGLADVPGMIVMRTVAMLANEAADTVNQGVCSPADLDLAMEKGVNYPCGPLAWADAIGIARVHRVLSHLAASYGEDRYRVSPRLAALRASGRAFRS
ncbi:3-hydroxyacyl-CoA dehydrogenase [Burkholderia ubonensis]|uniref:3-hydroxyacyl-CoA dehydrogenase n=1 Tax=Burkholderia ubonensis TaxID=101571 RepID=A0A102KUZ0_9BURK|nr:3-hydroxyacyl-CoA dehydrogenase [Burkholderia ubonensis]KUZ64828.1 3-hydroxyacyl-CoA dehydrogenase [Burkholderia ubonensis]KUZ81970.1 3-hydroxyacyl-CoA dehydrogenase [Burkholderia ubonensis]KVA01242.1 3-hydroxyacyl-CoA dehydrogenase [Burkholderia ubonensis]